MKFFERYGKLFQKFPMDVEETFHKSSLLSSKFLIILEPDRLRLLCFNEQAGNIAEHRV